MTVEITDAAILNTLGSDGRRVRLGWQGVEPLDKAKFEPVGEGGSVSELMTKPRRGGLWCSPLITSPAGECWGTTFSEIMHRLSRGADLPVTEVFAHETARVVVINSRDDLEAVVGRWPDPRRGVQWRPLQRETGPVFVDWLAMARDVDLLFVTREAVADCNVPHPDRPTLGMWDAATALFLNPTFEVGQHVPALTRAEVVERSEAMFEDLFQELRAKFPDDDEQELRAALTGIMYGWFNEKGDEHG